VARLVQLGRAEVAMLENTAYIGLSHEMALRRQLDVIANNLANMNTTGFKSERVLFSEYLVKSGGDARGANQVSFVLDKGTSRNLEDGKLASTDNPLDLAIEGGGYFVVGTPDGPRYTRSGHFRLSPTGELITSDGKNVLDKSGRPIKLTDQDSDFRVNADGSIVARRGPIAVLDVASFADERALIKEGNGLYATTPQNPARPADKAKVRQGMIENSNVVPIVELTNMIELQKSFTATREFLDKDQELRRKSIERLSKVA
jgi:flagellar basal-body rod protein FlgF